MAIAALGGTERTLLAREGVGIVMRRRNEGLIDRLSIAVASGTPVREWARANNLPVSTCYHWAGQPAFLESVARHRQALAQATIARVADKMAARIASDLLEPTAA